jgi:hypothetical protein
MAMKLIYFHGFGSSAASGTIRTLRERLPDFEVIAPDIPVDPAEALPFLRELCEQEQPNVVVGTSMGGMYAQQMFGFNRICVNPAFFMSKTSKVLKVGTFGFFKPRLDGQKEFTITEEIIAHFAEMEARQFDGVTPSETERVWGMFGINDTQENCEETFLQHYHNIIHFSGGHRLDDMTINEVLIPLIHLMA